MWLVLCSADDAAAHWAFEGLVALGVGPIRLLVPETMTQWCHWEHWLGAGGCGARITLADGLVIENERVQGVLNRLIAVPAGAFFGTPDFSYVAQELRALFLSWLESLPAPVINRPDPMGLSGPLRHVSEWLPLAARAGLPTPVYRLTSAEEVPEMYGERPLFPPEVPRRSVLVLGGQTTGAAAPPEIASACVRLAEQSEIALLGVDFVAGPEGPWTFAGATPHPDLRLGGEPLLDILARQLRWQVAA